ncbi:hypothetical protein BFW01_g12875 [Lasiodiplodia theobromae]|nr:hypothetical protein BFW01_g12875 [Lasiodiplodia theobromae]
MKMFNSLAKLSVASSLPALALSKPVAFANELRMRQTAAVPDSQNVSAPDFIGSPFAGQQLAPKPRFVPDALQAHIDGGNTRTDDFAGPLGNSPQAYSSTTRVGYLFWDMDTVSSTGAVLASLVCGEDPVAWCLAALDATTLEPVAQWTPQNRTTISNYWQILNGRAAVPTLEGFIVGVKLAQAEDGTLSFTEVGEWDVSGYMASGSIIATVGYAGDGNLWFTGTSAPLVGMEGANVSTIGYVQPADGTVHAIELENALIENGAAINGKTMYVVTGPAGSEDHANAVGHFYAVQAGTNGSVAVVYDEKYDAGSGMKPGGLSRGSGASVGLIGEKYVAITDNADVQVNLNVYLQADAMTDGANALVCSVPLFQPNASGNEAALTTYFDGTTYSASILNSYNSSWSFGQISTDGDINGPQNDLGSTAPGIARVDITEAGECSLVWDINDRVTMTTLSTATGLLYGYTQDYELAQQGEYVWYVVAYDFSTGEEVWRARMGAGGVYSGGVSHIQLGPGGRIFEGIGGGVAWMQDSASAYAK